MKRVRIFPNGVHMVFDEAGEQVPTAQGPPWMSLLLEHLESAGIDLAGEIEIIMPDGRAATPIRTDDGRWNWSVAP